MPEPICDRCEHPASGHRREGCRRRACPCDGYFPLGSDRPIADARTEALRALAASIDRLTETIGKAKA